ncbi:hypothetical protein DEO72_LG1g1730 [Vigna unguiculata]|uniref:Uncharacterized protein n=1 Tax=Vigna unguiculata TaxID=3917 RepID=A0A4D6KUB9_VIGUN|nr:hypothetical protein DEO72_LG1g1730 [Vigna unguiculata]
MIWGRKEKNQTKKEGSWEIGRGSWSSCRFPGGKERKNQETEERQREEEK